MNVNQIKTICSQKRAELIKRYFGNLVDEAAHIMPETLNEDRYSMDLPAQIEAEYRSFLMDLLAQIAPEKSIDKILDKHHLSISFTEDDREQLKTAYKDAKTITVWEKLTKSNHQDVTYYKGLLQAYSEELLSWMEIDFIEDIK